MQREMQLLGKERYKVGIGSRFGTQRVIQMCHMQRQLP
jgi:hypothetical protein